MALPKIGGGRQTSWTKARVEDVDGPALDLFDAVQAKLSEQTTNHRTTRMNSEALLTGRIFDDRGNRMSPSHAPGPIRILPPPPFSMAQPSAPDRCAECRQPTSRRWSSGRFASISNHRRRLTTAASSILTSHELRFSRSS